MAEGEGQKDGGYLQMQDNICRFNSVYIASMKVPKTIFLLSSFCVILLVLSSCSLFGPKYGCPSDGKNVGAERVLSGEKVPKAPRFKA
jgi:hypothetical protein